MPVVFFEDGNIVQCDFEHTNHMLDIIEPKKFVQDNYDFYAVSLIVKDDACIIDIPKEYIYCMSRQRTFDHQDNYASTFYAFKNKHVYDKYCAFTDEMDNVIEYFNTTYRYRYIKYNFRLTLNLPYYYDDIHFIIVDNEIYRIYPTSFISGKYYLNDNKIHDVFRSGVICIDKDIKNKEFYLIYFISEKSPVIQVKLSYKSIIHSEDDDDYGDVIEYHYIPPMYKIAIKSEE